jgi:hypothetical protein
MNTSKASATVIGIAALLLATTGRANDPAAKPGQSQVQKAIAANSVSAVVEALPELEQLWTTDPEAYVRISEQAMGVLESGGNDPTARAALFGIYDQVVKKECPADVVTATACYRLRNNLVLRFFAYKEVAEDRARLLAFAKFIGEVRSRMIPNYQNRGSNRPGFQVLMKAGVMEAKDIKDPNLRAEYENAVKQNEQDVLMNYLQLELFSISSLTTALTTLCARFSTDSPQDVEFRKQVAVAARLSEEEREKLKTGKW